MDQSQALIASPPSRRRRGSASCGFWSRLVRMVSPAGAVADEVGVSPSNVSFSSQGTGAIRPRAATAGVAIHHLRRQLRCVARAHRLPDEGLLRWPSGDLRACSCASVQTGIRQKASASMTGDLPRRLVAEALGTALLVATVVGSGIMAESLTRDTALALLGNTLPTGAMLVVLISILGPLSGAHFNPAVSLVFALKRELSWRDALLYIAAQVAGGIAGTVIAHLMFALPLVDMSLKVRTGGAQWVAEAVATFGLIATILGGIRFKAGAVPWLVGLYITAAYWFTASTSSRQPCGRDCAVPHQHVFRYSSHRPAGICRSRIRRRLVGARRRVVVVQ